MELRNLGHSDLKITPLGVGAWAMGGGGWAYGWGPQDDRQSIAAIRAALEAGWNWIDTAAVYGLGHSEEIVAAALRDFPPSMRPYVFTKCGLVWDLKNRNAQAARIGNAASIRREVEASLTRLGIERIDLLQMHWPAEDAAIEDYWQTLLALKQEGKVRAVGLSNHSVEHLEVAEQFGHVDTLQPPFSAIRRNAAAAELPWCQQHETGIICYSPMQSGLLTGAFTPERAAALPSNDWRSRNPEFNGANLRRNLALVEALRPLANRHCVSVGVIAIAWALAWPGITAAIVGARNPRQVDGWLAAATLELSNEELKEIAAAIEATGAGSGPVFPTAQNVATAPFGTGWARA